MYSVDIVLKNQPFNNFVELWELFERANLTFEKKTWKNALDGKKIDPSKLEDFFRNINKSYFSIESDECQIYFSNFEDAFASLSFVNCFLDKGPPGNILLTANFKIS